MLKRNGYEGFKGKIDTLSPLDLIGGIGDDVELTLIVGSQDDVTPPLFSEGYQAEAAKLGKTGKLVVLEGKGHEIFLDSAVFNELASMLR